MAFKVIINAAKNAASEANQVVKVTVLPAAYAEGAKSMSAGSDFASRDEKALRYAGVSRSDYRQAITAARYRKR